MTVSVAVAIRNDNHGFLLVHVLMFRIPHSVHVREIMRHYWMLSFTIPTYDQRRFLLVLMQLAGARAPCQSCPDRKIPIRIHSPSSAAITYPISPNIGKPKSIGPAFE